MDITMNELQAKSEEKDMQNNKVHTEFDNQKEVETVQGKDVEELEEVQISRSGMALDKIFHFYDRGSTVKQEIGAENSLLRVPAGTPARTPPDLSALSPREKIKYAIEGS